MSEVCVRLDPDIMASPAIAGLSSDAFRALLLAWARVARLRTDGVAMADIAAPMLAELQQAGAVSVCGDRVRLIAFGACHGRPLVRFSVRDARWSKEAYPAVFARDGLRCRYCGKAKPRRDLSVDHVRPRVQGGHDGADNLAVACKSCNSRKWARTPEQAGMALLPAPAETR